MSPKHRIFLSHSGRDAVLATHLAATLESELAHRGHDVAVFNTSEPEYRYQDLKEVLNAGDQWQQRAQEYEKELRAYLRKNLVESSAFLALVTRNSIAAASKVIEFEIDIVRTATRAQEKFSFFPCAAEGASLSDLPEGAKEFQGIELDANLGLKRLLEALDRALSRKH